VQQDVRVTFDEAGRQRCAREIDDLRASRCDALRRTDGVDTIAFDAYRPARAGFRIVVDGGGGVCARGAAMAASATAATTIVIRMCAIIWASLPAAGFGRRCYNSSRLPDSWPSSLAPGLVPTKS
jgi:hypothetical protein